MKLAKRGHVWKVCSIGLRKEGVRDSYLGPRVKPYPHPYLDCSREKLCVACFTMPELTA